MKGNRTLDLKFRSQTTYFTTTNSIISNLLKQLNSTELALSSSLSDGRYWVLPSGELLIPNLTATDAYSRVSCRAAHIFDTSPRASNTARVIVTSQFRLVIVVHASDLVDNSILFVIACVADFLLRSYKKQKEKEEEKSSDAQNLDE